MGFDGIIASSSAFTVATGFSPGEMFGWATTTIDTFGALIFGSLVYTPPIIAGLMILAIVLFAFVTFYVFRF